MLFHRLLEGLQKGQPASFSRGQGAALEARQGRYDSPEVCLWLVTEQLQEWLEPGAGAAIAVQEEEICHGL